MGSATLTSIRDCRYRINVLTAERRHDLDYSKTIYKKLFVTAISNLERETILEPCSKSIL